MAVLTHLHPRAFRHSIDLESHSPTRQRSRPVGNHHSPLPRLCRGTCQQTMISTHTSPSKLCSSQAYLESVSILAAGCSSRPFSVLFRSKSHNSNWVSFEKSASTAPARVPVASNGKVVPGDHANVAVRGISRSRTMLMERGGLGQSVLFLVQARALQKRSPTFLASVRKSSHVLMLS